MFMHWIIKVAPRDFDVRNCSQIVEVNPLLNKPKRESFLVLVWGPGQWPNCKLILPTGCVMHQWELITSSVSVSFVSRKEFSTGNKSPLTDENTKQRNGISSKKDDRCWSMSQRRLPRQCKFSVLSDFMITVLIPVEDLKRSARNLR